MCINSIAVARVGSAEHAKRSDAMLAASVGASLVVRKAASLAFAKQHRSMTTPDLMSCIGLAFFELFDASRADGVSAEPA